MAPRGTAKRREMIAESNFRDRSISDQARIEIAALSLRGPLIGVIIMILVLPLWREGAAAPVPLMRRPSAVNL